MKRRKACGEGRQAKTGSEKVKEGRKAAKAEGRNNIGRARRNKEEEKKRGQEKEGRKEGEEEEEEENKNNIL